MSYLAVRRQEDALNAYYEVKDAKLKRVHALPFQLYDMTFWKRRNYGDSKKVSGPHSTMRGEGWAR